MTVEEIHADRVILDNNGRLETLKMEDIGEDRPALSLIVGDSDNSGALVPVDSDDSNPVNDDATVEQQLAQLLIILRRYSIT